MPEQEPLSAVMHVVVFLLAMLVAAAMLWLAAWLLARLTTPAISPLESLLWWLNRVWARVFWKAKISGPLPVPPHAGAIIICNHRSPVDPSLVVLTVRRKIHWLVAREYTVQPLWAWFFRRTGSIPVNRSGIDTAATKMAIRLAQEGQLVALFPEGRINTGEELLGPARLGAAMIALKARVPVVPCFIGGTPYSGTIVGSIFTPGRAEIVIGQPIDLSPHYGQEEDRAVLAELTLRLMRQIATLGGHPEFEPKVVGPSARPSNGAT